MTSSRPTDLLDKVRGVHARLVQWLENQPLVQRTSRPAHSKDWRLDRAGDCVALHYAQLETVSDFVGSAAPHTCAVSVVTRLLGSSGVLLTVEVTRSGHITYTKSRWIIASELDQIERFLYASSLVVRTHFRGIRPERIYDGLFD